MIIIDRFEEDFAILEEDEKTFEEEKTLLPDDAKEGDVLIKINNIYKVDEEATNKRRAEILNKLRRL